MSDTIAVLKEILEHAKGERRTDGQIIDDRGLHSLPKQAYVKDYKKWDSIVAALSDAIAAIEWVPVSERLPEIGTEVNVLREDDTVTSLCRLIPYENAPNYFWDNNYGGCNVHLPESIKAWRPLPAPPKEAP
jgi:hypothetical protein